MHRSVFIISLALSALSSAAYVLSETVHRLEARLEEFAYQLRAVCALAWSEAFPNPQTPIEARAAFGVEVATDNVGRLREFTARRVARSQNASSGAFDTIGADLAM